MNRGIRSSSGHRLRTVTRTSLLGLALGLAACSSDLFHDTKWQSRCDAEPDAAVCPQGVGGASSASSTSEASSTSSATSVSSSGSSGGGSATSTAGVGGAASTSTGTSMMASTSTGP